MPMKPVPYFPRDPFYKRKAVACNGSSQWNKRLFRASTYCALRCAHWFLGWEQIILTIPEWVWFPSISCLAIWLPFVAYQLLELKATNKPSDRNILLGRASGGSRHFLVLLSSWYVTASSAVHSGWLPTSLQCCGPWDQPEERAGENRKEQRGSEYLYFFNF